MQARPSETKTSVTGLVTTSRIPHARAMRGRGCDNALAIASPAQFIVIASRVVSADRLDVVLRGEHEGPLAGAQRHAALLARVVADRFRAPACADVLTADGLPVCSVARFPVLAGGAR